MSIVTMFWLFNGNSWTYHVLSNESNWNKFTKNNTRVSRISLMGGRLDFQKTAAYRLGCISKMIPQILGPVSFAWTYFMLKNKNVTLDTLPWGATTFVFGRVLTPVCLRACQKILSFFHQSLGVTQKVVTKTTTNFHPENRPIKETRKVQYKSSHYLPPFFPELNLSLTVPPPKKKSKMASWKSVFFLKKRYSPPKTDRHPRKIHDYFRWFMSFFRECI